LAEEQIRRARHAVEEMHSAEVDRLVAVYENPSVRRLGDRVIKRAAAVFTAADYQPQSAAERLSAGAGGGPRGVVVFSLRPGDRHLSGRVTFITPEVWRDLWVGCCWVPTA
jgi:hypothetical protein